MSLLSFFEVGVRLASVLTLVWVTSFPGKVLAFEYERDILSQHLAFVRAVELGDPRVAGISREETFQSIVPQEGVQFTVTATAYSSTVAETDSYPFTTASGTHVHLGTLAANWLPLGTRVRLEGRIYIVEDRMRDSKGRWVDIWMSNTELAQQFGVRTLTLEIVQLP